MVAPSSIPRTQGSPVKTDRVDAGKLAQYYAAGILAIFTVPEKEMESARELMRTRQFILHQLAEVRTHIQSLLRRNGRIGKSKCFLVQGAEYSVMLMMLCGVHFAIVWSWILGNYAQMGLMGWSFFKRFFEMIEKL